MLEIGGRMSGGNCLLCILLTPLTTLSALDGSGSGLLPLDGIEASVSMRKEVRIVWV